MKVENINKQIVNSLNDNKITAKEASEIRDNLITLSLKDKQKLFDKIPQDKLTSDASTIINDIFANKDVFTFSQSQKKLVKSISFQRVFPNFSSLSESKQLEVLESLDIISKKFPNFVEKLSKVTNNNYGKGFQFFFANENSKELNKIVKDGFAGIVLPGSNVIKNPVMHSLISPLAHIEALKKLDIGAMHTHYPTKGLFIHEMMHAVHLNMLNDDQRDEIGNLFDNAVKNDSFITEYAKTNPYEYFADSVEAYLTGNPEELREKDPKMYKFVEELFNSQEQYGKDGNLFTDPETFSYTFAHNNNGQNLHGITISRDSSLVTIEHFNGSTVSDLSILGNDNSFLAKGSFGVKAEWKPWNEPVGLYATAGGTANVGMTGGKATAGIGAFVGGGFNAYNFNAEVRQNFNTNNNSTEVRVGYRIEF